MKIVTDNGKEIKLKKQVINGDYATLIQVPLGDMRMDAADRLFKFLNTRFAELGIADKVIVLGLETRKDFLKLDKIQLKEKVKFSRNDAKPEPELKPEDIVSSLDYGTIKANNITQEELNAIHYYLEELADRRRRND